MAAMAFQTHSAIPHACPSIPQQRLRPTPYCYGYRAGNKGAIRASAFWAAAAAFSSSERIRPISASLCSSLQSTKTSPACGLSKTKALPGLQIRPLRGKVVDDLKNGHVTRIFDSAWLAMRNHVLPRGLTGAVPYSNSTSACQRSM